MDTLVCFKAISQSTKVAQWLLAVNLFSGLASEQRDVCSYNALLSSYQCSTELPSLPLAWHLTEGSIEEEHHLPRTLPQVLCCYVSGREGNRFAFLRFCFFWRVPFSGWLFSAGEIEFGVSLSELAGAPVRYEVAQEWQRASDLLSLGSFLSLEIFFGT